MGLCFSLDDEEKKAKEKSARIDSSLMSWAEHDQHIVKILLLGAGESGKSTLVKQMKIIHNDGFTYNELLSFKPTVLDNLLSSMKYVLAGMGLLRINLDNPKNKIFAQAVLSCQCCFDDNIVMLPFMEHALRSLWQDAGVRMAVAHGYEYELNDSAIYYFENMDRLFGVDYHPTPIDVLRARVRTNGVIETHFHINDVQFRIFDVGGQRSERRKWIQCFDDMRAIMFVAALSGYDMTLFEDPNVNRLEESLTLFSQICNNRFFVQTSMILFLNKLDLFRDKILYSGRHLRYYFSDYSGGDRDVNSAAQYVNQRFQLLNHNPSKIVYSHFTTATDTKNIQIVLTVVMETIIRDNVEKISLL